MNNIQYLLDQKMFKAALQTAERHIYLEAYKTAKHNQSATARLLGVSRGTVINKLKEWRTI